MTFDYNFIIVECRFFIIIKIEREVKNMIIIHENQTMIVDDEELSERIIETIDKFYGADEETTLEDEIKLCPMLMYLAMLNCDEEE